MSLGVFLVSELLPGDVAIFILGQQATPENLAVLRNQLGLNVPAPQRYVTWLLDFLRGDWGRSLALQVPVLGPGPLARRELAGAGRSGAGDHRAAVDRPRTCSPRCARAV